VEKITVVETDVKTGRTRTYQKQRAELPPAQPRRKAINLYALVDALVKTGIIKREDVETEME
jgi:hypothetical protein